MPSKRSTTGYFLAGISEPPNGEAPEMGSFLRTEERISALKCPWSKLACDYSLNRTNSGTCGACHSSCPFARGAAPGPRAFSGTKKAHRPLWTPQGRVIVRHSPCTPWRLPAGLGTVPHIPKTPGSRGTPFRTHPPNPHRLALPARGREGTPLSTLSPVDSPCRAARAG